MHAGAEQQGSKADQKAQANQLAPIAEADCSDKEDELTSFEVSWLVSRLYRACISKGVWLRGSSEWRSALGESAWQQQGACLMSVPQIAVDVAGLAVFSCCPQHHTTALLIDLLTRQFTV